MMWRFTKGFDEYLLLSKGHLLGQDLLHECFLAQVTLPLPLMMLCDAEHTQLKEAGDLESRQCYAERQVQAFSHRQTGGFKTKKAREFQNSLSPFATGTLRFAEPILNVRNEEFTNKRIIAYIAPFAGKLFPPGRGKTDLSDPEVSNEGDEEIRVRETPFDRPDDVIVEASGLEEYLNNMSP
ncbi:unnamed protein product [Ectocarpus sp. CCAP 1310/34]|nr:unnamed protein product [Ectocarpus sp. CCAP 1310/34]